MHVLLNLLNELSNILLLFRNEFNKLNNTGARMLDSIYDMTLKLLKNRFFSLETLRFCYLYARYNGRHYVTSLNL